MPFGALNLFMSFVYAEIFFLFFLNTYLLRSFLKNNKVWINQQSLWRFFLFVWLFVGACVCVWVCLLKSPWKIAVHAYTKQSDCIKREIFDFIGKSELRWQQSNVTIINFEQIVVESTNNKTIWKQGKMESILHRRKKWNDRRKWCMMLTK